MSIDSDRSLLRRFEPIIRYTRGEQFFPYNVETYVKACSLWMQQPGTPAVCLVPEGELTLGKLAEPLVHGFNTIYFLKFIDPLNIKDLAVYTLKQGLRKKNPKNIFLPGHGRLARVGYGARLVDALFSLTLLTRGRVPGDTAAAAALAYQQMLRIDSEYCYYGRVVHQNGWIALQYWFFYPFNNWRSGFFGANDHEADWEMIYVYLSETDLGELQPEWVAYASHDYAGDDLRRHWDDPELEKVGEHPIIYAGAGSHASYYAPGEYLAELELPFLSPVHNFFDRLQTFWRNILRYGQNDIATEEHNPGINIFRVPFVDYARGDGIVVGPGGDLEWGDPGLLSPTPDWAIKYRGLWGLYARDPVAGENAPAGPVYNRDGLVRRSWYDPLGWAGLDKVPPSRDAIRRVDERIEEIELHRRMLAGLIAEKSEQIASMGVEAESMQGRPHLASIYITQRKLISTLSEELRVLRAEYASQGSVLETLELYAQKLQRGERGPLRAHIRRAHRPTPTSGIQFSRLAEAWAAISIGLMIFGIVGIALFARQYLINALLLLIFFLLFVEASFRRQLTQLINIITIGFASISVLVLIYEFFWSIVIIAIFVAGGYIVWENLKELRS
jgi:hypothetical protein